MLSHTKVKRCKHPLIAPGSTAKGVKPCCCCICGVKDGGGVDGGPSCCCPPPGWEPEGWPPGKLGNPDGGWPPGKPGCPPPIAPPGNVLPSKY
ncbi:hypothetical protein KDN24_03535 [Bacillus sp. Bva_UNVM-123]|uniref:hypothetical protein n=1 Tax=Bacillus sp. Bva_UNVM-123 TaxID=2829798 RepID=UPI00391F11BE